MRLSPALLVQVVGTLFASSQHLERCYMETCNLLYSKGKKTPIHFLLTVFKIVLHDFVNFSKLQMIPNTEVMNQCECIGLPEETL